MQISKKIILSTYHIYKQSICDQTYQNPKDNGSKSEHAWRYLQKPQKIMVQKVSMRVTITKNIKRMSAVWWSKIRIVDAIWGGGHENTEWNELTKKGFTLKKMWV